MGMSSISSLIMRCLSFCGIRVESFMYFENYRRPKGCQCLGCLNWKQVEEGRFTVEQLGQEVLRCDNRYLAWRASSHLHTRWNPVMAIVWILVMMAALVSPLHSIGVMAIVTTAGKNDLLTQYFKGSAYTAAWFVGLVDGGTTPTYAAGDTMASHAGWTENVGYSNANRVTWTGGTASAGSIDNSGSPAAFNINATGTIAGDFVVSNSTKSGTTGVLYSESNFTQGNRSVVSGDTLNVTATETAA